MSIAGGILSVTDIIWTHMHEIAFKINKKLLDNAADKFITSTELLKFTIKQSGLKVRNSQSRRMFPLYLPLFPLVLELISDEH